MRKMSSGYTNITLSEKESSTIEIGVVHALPGQKLFCTLTRAEWRCVSWEHN